MNFGVRDPPRLRFKHWKLLLIAELTDWVFAEVAELCPRAGLEYMTHPVQLGS